MKKILDLSCRRWIALSICVVAGNGFAATMMLVTVKFCHQHFSSLTYTHIERAFFIIVY